MSVGYPLNKQVIDSRVGYLTKTLDDTLDGFATLKTTLDRLQDSDLTGMGYTADDITVLRGIAAAMAKLRQVAHGQDTQSPASDYFYYGPKVTALD